MHGPRHAWTPQFGALAAALDRDFLRHRQALDRRPQLRVVRRADERIDGIVEAVAIKQASIIGPFETIVAAAQIAAPDPVGDVLFFFLGLQQAHILLAQRLLPRLARRCL